MRLSRVEEKVDDLDRKVDSLDRKVDSLDRAIRELARSLPGIVGEVVREVWQQRDGK